MGEHVIEFAPDGVARAMHNDNFDLSFLGRQSIWRATEIKFNEDTQKWDICMPIIGPDDVGGHYPMGCGRSVDNACGFDTYEEARTIEVEWLNSCRFAGVNPESSEGLRILLLCRLGK